jgi:hypothetical protein
MKNSVLMMLVATGSLAGFAACSGTGDDTQDDTTPECSDEEYQAPLEAGGAGGGGGPGAECEMPSEPATAIEIVGSYTDQFGFTVEITTTGWSFGDAVFTFSIVDNDENYAIARGAESAEWNPCAYNTFVWHEEGGDLYYCQSVFDATSECGALHAARPDSEDLLKGCSGFKWSKLTEN